MRTKILAVMLSTLVALMWTALPASAVPPEITRFSETNIGGEPEVFADACGLGVDLIGFFELKGSETVHFDQDGTPFRVVLQIVINRQLTRTDTGNMVRDPARLRGEFDLITGEETFSGLDWNVTYPGTGAVFQALGRIVFSPTGEVLFSAGPADYLTIGDPLVAVCDALA